ncbi:MAG: DUF6506 family protein [Succinivibrio sp.]
MKLEAAFIFLAPNTDFNRDRAVVETEAVNLNVIGVNNYDEACTVAADLVKKGVGAIELCGGFGIEGVARVAKAAGKNVKVGAVRFDCHPGLEFKSGDELFA